MPPKEGVHQDSESVDVGFFVGRTESVLFGSGIALRTEKIGILFLGDARSRGIKIQKNDMSVGS